MKLTAQQGIFFDVFRHRIAPRYPDSDFWQRLVLRESVIDEGVRDCIVALGAMWQGLHQEQRWRRSCAARPGGCAPFAFGVEHREAARHFGRAISKFRATLAREGASVPPRTIFIATYLFVVFEQIQGNAENADNLLVNSMVVLRPHLSLFHRAHIDNPKLAADLDDDGMDVAERTLSRLAAINPVGQPFSKRLQILGSELGERISTTPVPDPGVPIGDMMSSWDTLVSRVALWVLRTSPIAAQSKIDSFTTMMRTQQDILKKFQLWRELFNTMLVDENITQEQQIIFLAAVSCLKMCEICTACCFDQTEMIWDDYTADFNDMLSKAETMGDNPDLVRTQTDYYIKCFFMLYVITQKCRDRVTRRWALRLLRQMTSDDVSCDIKMLIISCEVHVAKEELGRDATGHIPSSKRYSWTGYAWNDNRTAIVLTFRRAVADENGNMVSEETSVRPEDFGLA
jgi:hypothetical protein